MQRPLLSLVAFAALAAGQAHVPPFAAAAVIAPEGAMIGTFKLPGGLEIVASEDHAQANAVIDTFVNAGSAADFSGVDGVAAATAMAIWHGAKTPPADAIAALGGTSKVLIDRSVTQFQAVVPADKVDQAIAAIGEAFSHPDWAALDLAGTGRAFEAAAHEASATLEDQAFQVFMEASSDRAHGHRVYGYGPMAAGRPDIEAFFSRYYVPSNIKVVLVGNFDTGKEVGQVVRGYAAVLQRTASVGTLPGRAPANAQRTVLHPAKPLVLIGAQGPAIANQREQAGLEIAMDVLAAPASGRLDRALAAIGGARIVAQRWQRSAGASQMFIEVEAEAASVDTVQKGVVALLAELRANPVTLDEHSKAMARVVKRAEEEVRHPETRGRDLGLASLGANDPYWIRTYPEEVRQVSRQEVMAVAQKFLAPSDVKVLVVMP